MLHIIPDDTETMPTAEHQIASETPKVTQEHSYNTQARRIQEQELMANYVTTINNITSTPINPAPLVRPAGEEWAVINQVTSELTL